MTFKLLCLTISRQLKKTLQLTRSEFIFWVTFTFSILKLFFTSQTFWRNYWRFINIFLIVLRSLLTFLWFQEFFNRCTTCSQLLLSSSTIFIFDSIQIYFVNIFWISHRNIFSRIVSWSCSTSWINYASRCWLISTSRNLRNDFTKQIHCMQRDIIIFVIKKVFVLKIDSARQQEKRLWRWWAIFSRRIWT